jgi:hypothetical protein
MGRVDTLLKLKDTLSVPRTKEFQDEYGCTCLELTTPYLDKTIVIQIIESREQLERIQEAERAGGIHERG